MDFINRAYGQISDLFATMTVGARITAGLLVVAIVVSLSYLFTFQLQAGDDYLFGAREFSQPELDAMAQAFGVAGLDDYDFNRYRVRVPRRQRFQYLQALSDNQFTPESFDSALDEVLSSNNSWFESKQLRDLKVKHATQKKLARMVSEINGIKDASVQCDEQRKGGYPPVIEKKAIVTVKATGMKPLDATMVRTVQRTVCGGVAGLEPDNVTVIDLVGGRSYTGKSDSGENGAADTVYADTKAMFEERWQRDIYDMLSMYPGIVVGVNVELDPDLKSETSKVTYEPQATTVQQSSETESDDSRPSNGGRPGTVPNGAVQSNVPRDITTLSNMSTTSEKSRENSVSLAGHEHVIEKKASLTPQRVTAAIAVPRSYLVDLFYAEPGNESAQEPDDVALRPFETKTRTNIQDSVESLLPYADQIVSADRRVRVTVFRDLEPEPIPEPAMTATAMVWFSDNWQTLGLLGVGLLSLLMLRGMVRSGTSSTVAEPQLAPMTLPMDSASPAADDVADAAVEDGQPMLSRRTTSTGASLRDELTAMVKEDPDAAANVIRTWIGDAA